MEYNSLATVIIDKYMEEKELYTDPMIAAMRGRNPDNPSERGRSNGQYVQRLEINETGTSNTITSVQKDNLVVEPLISVHPISHKHEFNIDSGIKSISPALRATDYKAPHCVYEPSVLQVGNIVDDTNIGFKNPQRGRIYDQQGLSPALNCCGGGGLEPKIVDAIYNNRETREYTEYSPALRSERTGLDVQQHFRIRKLTPRECFRLMDVDDATIDKIQQAGISNSQQYKLAGNSIVVANLYHLFRKMFVEPQNENRQLTLF